MSLNSADRKTEQALLWLFGVSFIVHFALCIVSFYFIENETKGTNLYAFYRTRITGEKITRENTFISSLNAGYKTTCPLDPSSVESLLILRSSYNSDMDKIMQTCLPAMYQLFGLPHANGYLCYPLSFFSPLFSSSISSVSWSASIFSGRHAFALARVCRHVAAAGRAHAWQAMS